MKYAFPSVGHDSWELLDSESPGPAMMGSVNFLWCLNKLWINQMLEETLAFVRNATILTLGNLRNI